MKEVKIEDLDFTKGKNLIPVIVQDYKSNEVLTLAYVNKEALIKSIETKHAHYYRRSKGRVMMKGETSGHTQRVLNILVDCDKDALIFQIVQKGLACHLWMRSCFHNKLK